MTKAEKIIYLIVGSSYFSDDPERLNEKTWWMDAYENKEDANEKVIELVKKEIIRIKNLTTDKIDYKIRHHYTVNSIILYGNEETKI